MKLFAAMTTIAAINCQFINGSAVKSIFLNHAAGPNSPARRCAVALILSAAVLLPSCSKSPSSQQQKIVIKGSNTVGEELAPRLIAEYKKTHTDLDFDTVQSIGLANGLVDNKSAAIDERWQALRFVYRLRDR